MSYATSYYLFFALYVAINAAGPGLCYMLPVKNAWLFFPKKKGMVSGIILSCYSFGAILWSFLTTFLVNPGNLLPALVVSNGHAKELLFEPNSEVVQRVPMMLRAMAYTYLGLVLVAAALITKKEDVGGSSIREPLIYNSLDMT
jgi:hypothetical protein